MVSIIQDIMKSIDFTIPIDNSEYFHDKKRVPRVTHILSSMLYSEGLIYWSNALGLYKRRKYKEEIDTAAFIGTNTHNFIEYYIKQEESKIVYDNLSLETRRSIHNGVDSFILWYNNLKNHKVEVLGIEQTLTCEWFGGTYDLLIKIDGKIYLVDFKTSNYISCRYFYQLAAYRYMLSLNGIELDGAIILQVSKKSPAFEEYVVDLHNGMHSKFMQDCENTFFSLVYAYYNRLNTEKEFNIVFKNKRRN